MKKVKAILFIFIATFLALSILPAQSNAVGEAIAIAVEVSSFDSSNTSSSSGSTLLRTEGNTTTSSGSLRLTKNIGNQRGTVVRRNQIKLTDGFSTYFQFKITSTSTPADGIAFIVYQSDNVQIGNYGEGLGYWGIDNSMIVEFDTYCNGTGSQNDPSSPHVAIMVDGNPNHSGQTAYPYASLTSGNVIHAWVDYDGSTITATYGTSSTRGDNTTITRNVGNALVGKNVYMGFSASTGGCYSYHDILKWYFKDSYVSGGLSSDANAYTQAASTVGITFSPGSTNPTSANIKVYDASGSAMSSDVDIYVDNSLVATQTAGVSGYTYNLPSLSIGNHTIRAVAPGGASNFATLTVSAYPPAISANPSSQSVNVGETASFGVAATSPDGGALTYQWQVYSSGSWSNISGANGSTYTTDTLTIADNGKKYRCTVTNTNGTKVASATSGEAALAVNRLTGTVSIMGDSSKTYDGTAASAPAVSKNGSGAVTYTYYADDSGSLGSQLSGAPADAGTYWVKATVAQCDTYTQATTTKQFTITLKTMADDAEAEPLISYSLDSETYDGSQKPVGVSAASGVTGLGDITVYYTGTGDTVYAKSSTAPVDAGTYTVSVDIAQGSNYGSYDGLELGNYTINNADITGVTTADYSGTYDGTEHGFTLNGVPSDATVTFRMGNAGEYSLSSMPGFAGAGTYLVGYKISKTNYNSMSGTAQVVIAQKAMTTHMVENIAGTFIYNGTTQTPSPVITDGDPSIMTASDYTVSYADNICPGTATVTITASANGNYSGSVSKTFEISPRALEDDMIADMDALVFNGGAQTPVPTVTDGDPSIIAASDYTVSYSDNTYPGTATVTLAATANGNYAGTASKTFVIGKKALVSDMISDIDALTYTGSALTPEFTVTDGDPTIITTSDYTVGYSNNTHAGTAMAVITAKEDGNYTGTAMQAFVINKKELYPDMIADIMPVAYNGGAQTPVLTVTDGTPSVIESSDYTVSYANNTDTGTATATITASADGNYRGTASVTFVIDKKALDADMLSDISAVIYNGEAQTPTLAVNDGTPSAIDESDYTISYTDNTDAGTATATITATTNGNYSGTVSKTFTINKKVLTRAMIGSIAAQTYTGELLKPRVTVKDGKPNIISTSDYTVSYADNMDAGTATAIITAKQSGNYSGSVSKTFDIAPALITGTVSVPTGAESGGTVKADVSGILPTGAHSALAYQWKRNGVSIKGAAANSYAVTSEDIGKELTVTVTGKGNFYGSMTSANVTVSAPETLASPITLATPVFKDGKIVIGGTVTLAGDSYTANISLKTEKDRTWRVLENGNYSSGNAFNVDLPGLKPDTVYIYRITAIVDGQTYTMTGRFRTPGASVDEALGSITGSVLDNTGLGAGITVTIEEGNTIIASQTGLKNGDTFTFTQLPDGIYNVVANNGSYRVTHIITVKNGKAVDGVKMTIGKKQSILEVKTEDTPNIAVGGLNELFNYDSMYTTADAEVVAAGGTVEIKLIVEKQDEVTSSEGDRDKIAELAGNDNIAMYLDLSVIKTVYDNGSEGGEQTNLSEIADLIEVVIPRPEELKGKSGLAIYRMHNDIAEVVPEGIKNANSDGEYCTIEDEYITLYLKNFCTYAIGYAQEAREQGCCIYWWLLVILIALIITGILITRRNSRLQNGQGGEIS